MAIPKIAANDSAPIKSRAAEASFFTLKLKTIIPGRSTIMCENCGEVRKVGDFNAIPEYSKEIKGEWYVAFHRACRFCSRKITAKKTDELYCPPEVQNFLRKKFSSQRLAAERRQILWVLCLDDLVDMWVRQGGRCSLSGVPLTIARGKAGRGGRAATSLSIDRIDSRVGYLRGNCHLVTSVVNIMKSDMSVAEFTRVCAAVVQTFNKNNSSFDPK